MSQRQPLQQTDKAGDGEPRPWERPEDAHGWRVVGRGRGTPGPLPRIALEVAFDAEQSVWLRQEAERTGLNPAALIMRLVDRARGRP